MMNAFYSRLDESWGLGHVVRLVGPLLLVKATLHIAPRTVIVVVTAILTAEALERRPSLQQRGIHREVVT